MGLEVEGEGDEERDRECEERDLRSLVEEEEERVVWWRSCPWKVDVERESFFVVVWVTRAGRAAVYVCCNTSREGVGSKTCGRLHLPFRASLPAAAITLHKKI